MTPACWSPGQGRYMASPIPALSSPRLTLVPLAQDDAEAIQILFPHWNIVAFLAPQVPWPYPDDGAAVFLRDIALPTMAKGEAWHWSLRPKMNPDRLIGVISLRAGPDDNRGFWVAAEWQRRGLATEASEAVTDFWFEGLGNTILRVPKAIDNAGSRRISELSGMRVVWTGERDFVSGRHPAEIWEITADEWRGRRPPQH